MNVFGRFAITLRLKVLLLAIGVFPLICGSALAGQNQGDKVMVEMTTSKGVIELELDAKNAPITVANFLEYVKSGHYDGTIFHRVIPGFVIQGGGLKSGMAEKATRTPIENEADNGLKNLTGAICMARTNEPHSATSQFFINLKDNSFLDHTEKSTTGWGYAVFGRVASGMDVVKAIAAMPTGNAGGHSDVPLEDIVLEKAVVSESED
jgi:peptidyl-prolyl cis-trans isomerase B (cyclophilin B)